MYIPDGKWDEFLVVADNIGGGITILMQFGVELESSLRRNKVVMIRRLELNEAFRRAQMNVLMDSMAHTHKY